MGRQVTNAEIKTEIRKNVITVPAEDIPYQKGLGSTIFHKMLENSDKIAQTDGLTHDKETFGLLLQKCIRAAIKMRSKGLTSADVITICSFHHLDTCVPYLAALFLGAKVASIDASIPLEDAVHLLKQVCPRMVFTTPESVSLIESTLRNSEIEAEIIVFGESTCHLEFSEFLVPSPEEEGFAPIEVSSLKETAGIFFSSGTTGLPKGISLSHYGLLGCTHQLRSYAQPGDSMLIFSSFHWISSTIALLYSILHPSNRVLYPCFDSSKFWNQITTHKINVTFLPPMNIVAVCKDGLPVGADVSSLRYAFIGGGPISGQQISAIRRCLPKTIVLSNYGQTELSGPAVCFRPAVLPDEIHLAYKKPSSPGKFFPGVSYKIVDPETEEILGTNQEGELRIKSAYEMNGYYNRDASQCWDSEGFIKTGDIAYYDDDHCLFIVDRIKELMKFKMWSVAPAKLEGILLTHPAIQAAVVFGVPHPEDVDRPTAVVVLKESQIGALTPKDIEKYLEERVDDRERIRGGVTIVKSIPLTCTGKVSRMHMRNLLLRGEL